MPTFTMIKPDGTRGEAVDYRPVTVYVANLAERLALHRPSEGSEWRVSDPESGCLILKIKASYKGCPVSSACLNVHEARAAAKEQVPALAARVGFEHFNATLKKARAMRRAATAA
jgi:hypothetical protein